MWSRFRHSGRQKCEPGGTTNNYVRLLSLLLPKWKEGYQLMMGKLYQQITTKYFSCHQGKSGESVNKQHCFTATKHTCHQGSNISKDCSSLPASSSLWSSVQGLPVLHLSWSTPPRVYLDVQNLLHQQLRSPAMVQHQCLLPVDWVVVLPRMLNYSQLLCHLLTGIQSHLFSPSGLCNLILPQLQRLW